MLFRRLASTSTLRPTIRQLLSTPPANPTTIQVNGWVKSVRRQKRVAFAVISDGSNAQGLQAVLTEGDLARRLSNGACVRLEGTLVESPGAGQERELQVSDLDVLGECDPATYPMQKQALSTEYLRDQVHLRPRTDAINAMLRLRDASLRALHSYFEEHDFVYAHTPISTSSDCEGAGEAFQIAPIPEEASQQSGSHSPAKEFFGQPAFLTVSSQLHLEAIANAISRVYTISPCFRAERSQTGRHLAEFWMLEAEWAFTSSVNDVCDVVESSLKRLLATVLHGPDASMLWKGAETARRQSLENAHASSNWNRMSYTDAIRHLEHHHASGASAFSFRPVWGSALQSEHERWLAEDLVRGPVFVTDYPASLKPFYMRANEDGKTVACFDLLVPHVGELAGGSLREERLALLESSVKAHGLSQSDYGWYLDLRRYGSAPHGGFGLGFERLVSWLGGIDNVRECIAMPRWAGRMLL